MIEPQAETFSVLEIYTNYTSGLTQFAVKLRQVIKARSSVNIVCAHLGISRAMYYQRLRYPQNIEQSEVKLLANFLQEDDLLSAFRQTQQLSQLLARNLSRYLRDARLSIAFVCRKLGIHPTSFYRRQKDPRLWNRQQLEQIVKIVETVKGLGLN